jgi:hypothetical protein
MDATFGFFVIFEPFNDKRQKMLRLSWNIQRCNTKIITFYALIFISHCYNIINILLFRIFLQCTVKENVQDSVPNFSPMS